MSGKQLLERGLFEEVSASWRKRRVPQLVVCCDDEIIESYQPACRLLMLRFAETKCNETFGSLVKNELFVVRQCIHINFVSLFDHFGPRVFFGLFSAVFD